MEQVTYPETAIDCGCYVHPDYGYVECPACEQEHIAWFDAQMPVAA